MSDACHVTSGEHPRRVGPVDEQGTQDRGGDTQCGITRRRRSNAGHRSPRVSAVHVASGAQANGPLWPSGLWEDHDSVLRTPLPPRLRGSIVKPL